ncbi:MAG: hypothetical protein V1827_03750 [Candidatus Micrarchaeota archaeon]
MAIDGFALSKRDPDPAGAIFALKIAAEHLSSASASFSSKEFHIAFESSKNAIRLASSAVMARDGYISGTLDGTIGYLLQRYPGAFPLERWEHVESLRIDSGSGLYVMLMGSLGKLKKAGEQDAKEALAIASAFLETARAELM